MASNKHSRKNAAIRVATADPEQAAADIGFLIGQLKKMDFYQDRDAIAKIAKRYHVEWY